MANRFSDIALQFHDNAGAVLNGGLLYFYLTGTSTATDTYTDAALGTPNANPVVLDSAGRAGNIFLDPAVTYRAVLKDSTAATTYWTKDSINTVLDTDLTAIANNATNGLLARTGSGTVSARTITAGTDVSVSQGDGVAGNPTISLGSNVAKKAADNAFTAVQTITVATAGTVLSVVSTEAGSASGPDLVLYRNSASPLATDVLASILWDGEDSGGNQQTYGRIQTVLDDPTSGSEDATLSFGVVTAGTLASHLRLTGATLAPITSDGLALGTTALMYSDLFLASGGVVNWNAGGHTITQSGGALLFAGSAATAWRFNATIEPTTSDGAALGSGTLMFSDLFLASAGVINFNNGDVTITHGGNTITFAGATDGYTFNTGGVSLGAPTGGMPSAGSMNVAGDVYKNNTAYTNPDYVLEHFYRGEIELFKDNDGAKDYSGLMPLDELRDFTREYLRLPRIDDSPKGMFERGDIVLEKLEQLTLYVLDLHERIAELEARLARRDAS